jgi:RNA polymerase sigma-70 factor (ECF subfamily)
MFNVAMRIVKKTDEAEDVMQESMITAFNKLDTFKGEASFGSWLKRIVINNSIVQYKRSKRFVTTDEEILKDDFNDPIQEINDDFSKVKANKVIRCMEHLNDKYQQILNLHFIEGFDYEEICEIMHISYANCRTLISRAKESLRTKLLVES